MNRNLPPRYSNPKQEEQSKDRAVLKILAIIIGVVLFTAIMSI